MVPSFHPPVRDLLPCDSRLGSEIAWLHTHLQSQHFGCTAKATREAGCVHRLWSRNIRHSTSTRTPPHLPLCSVEKYPHSHINALTHIYARDSGEIIRPNNRRNNSKHNRFRTYTKGNRTAFRSTARFVGRHTSTSLSPGLGRRLFRPIDSHGKRIAYRSTQRREPRSHHDLEAAAAAQPAHGQQG